MDSFKDKGASARRHSASLRERFLTLERYVQMARLDADAALKRSEWLRPRVRHSMRSSIHF